MTQPGILFDDLEPNATYQVRHWLFVAADLTSHHWDGRAGTLVVVQGRSGKPDAKRDKGIYAVQEVVNAGPGGRQFLLAKQDDPDDPRPPAERKDDVYETYLGDGVLPPRCSCDAGRAGTPSCKHRDALAAVVKKGGLPEPEPATEDEYQ